MKPNTRTNEDMIENAGGVVGIANAEITLNGGDLIRGSDASHAWGLANPQLTVGKPHPTANPGIGGQPITFDFS